jgi:hypothetical protein
MTDDLQQVALDFENKLKKRARMQCLVEWDMGSKVREIIEEEAHYGSNAVQQLADYLGKQATTVYNWRNFAEAFDRQFVDTTSAEPMSNGEYLDTKHFYVMMKVTDGRKQRKLWNQVKQLSWSANQLEAEVGATAETKNDRSGGRKPQRPVSPSAGLESIRKDAQKVENLIPMICEASCDEIDEMSPDAVDEMLFEALTKARDTVAKMHDAAGVLLDRFDANIERVERVLEAKDAEIVAAKSAEAQEEVEDLKQRTVAHHESLSTTETPEPLEAFDDDFDEDFEGNTTSYDEKGEEVKEGSEEQVPVSAKQATGNKGRKKTKRATSGK